MSETEKLSVPLPEIGENIDPSNNEDISQAEVDTALTILHEYGLTDISSLTTLAQLSKATSPVARALDVLVRAKGSAVGSKGIRPEYYDMDYLQRDPESGDREILISNAGGTANITIGHLSNRETVSIQIPLHGIRNNPIKASAFENTRHSVKEIRADRDTLEYGRIVQNAVKELLPLL